MAGALCVPACELNTFHYWRVLTVVQSITMRIVALFVVILLQPMSVVAQPVRVTGTSVLLAPPPGFVASERFPGFERADLQASIMVTEIPAPASEMMRGMTAPALATRGMTLIASTTQVLDGRPSLLLKVSQQAPGATVLKWMIVSGDVKTSVMIVGSFPREREPQIGEAMKDAVLSTRWNAAAPPDPFEGLAFRISPINSLKIAGRMSNMLVLTETGQIAPQGAGAAVFVAGTSLAAVDLTDLKGFATARARQTKQLNTLRVLEERPTTIGGETAYELIADGKDAATGRPVTLYQVVLPDRGGYVLMQGMVASARAPELVPEFRKVAQTYRKVSH
jgi:hypothetical protein